MDNEKKYIVPVTATALTFVPSVAFADATSVTVSDFTGVLTALQAQVSVSTVVSVLTAGATAAIGLTFMWWGVRKLTQMLFSAFRKGRTNV